MDNYRKSSHTVYDIKYHIVWITKYRKQILRADISHRVRELTREICRAYDIEIMTDEVIMKYIEQQNIEPPDGDFKTEDDL